MFSPIFFWIFIAKLVCLELILNEGEQFTLNLDQTFQLDLASFSVSTSPSPDIEITITPRLQNFTYKTHRNFLKAIEKPLSPYFFVGLEAETLVLLKFNEDLNLTELATMELTNVLGDDQQLTCRSLLFINFSLILECLSSDDTSTQIQTQFLIFKINETTAFENSTNTTYLVYNFSYIDHFQPSNIPTYLQLCNRNKFFADETHLFYFCPFSRILEMDFKKPIRKNQMFIYEFDVDNSCFFELSVLGNMTFQDIIVVYANYYVVLDYQIGLLIYVFRDINVFLRTLVISLPETNYLFIKSRTIDSVYPDQIQNFLYVASKTNILEILYTSWQSIVYSKFYQLNQKNETNFSTDDLLVTPKFVIAIQKNDSVIQTRNMASQENLYIFKIFSNSLERVSSIHHIEYIPGLFLRGFTFNLFQDIVDNIVLCYTNETSNNIYEVIKIYDSNLVIGYHGFSEEEQYFNLDLMVSSNYNNKSVNFTSSIPIYLLPFNYTDLTFLRNFQRYYTFLDNYFQIPLNTISLGSNIDYEFLGNGIYDGSPDSNVGNIFLDYHSNLTIRDDAFANCTMLAGFMDFQAKALILLMHDQPSKKLFNVFCTDYDYGDRIIDQCVRDDTLLLINSLDSLHIEKDMIFIYSKSDSYQFYFCFAFEKQCGGNSSNINTKYIEVLFINKNLIIGRKNTTNGLSLDILAIEFSYNMTSKDPYNLLNVDIQITQNQDFANFDTDVLYMDANLIDFSILAVRTTEKLILLKVTSTDFSSYKFVTTLEYSIQNQCQIILMNMGLLVTICFSENRIREYKIENAYTITYTREYPLFWYILRDSPSPSTDQKYIYISGVDTRSGDSVLLIYNPIVATCELLIKICLLNHQIKKFIPVESTSDSYSLVYMLLSDVLYDELMVVNTIPYLYGNFSQNTFDQLYYKTKDWVQFDLMFTNGLKKIVISINSTISMNGSQLTKAGDLANQTNFFFTEDYIVNNSYRIPIENLFEGPIEDIDFSPNFPDDFPFIFEDILSENQVLSSYEESIHFFRKTIDMKFFNDTIIVLTEGLIVFLLNREYTWILSNQTVDFLEPSCKIAHHNQDMTFMVYCQGNELVNASDPGSLRFFSYWLNETKINEFLLQSKSLLDCFECLKINQSQVRPSEFYGKIKTLILRNEYFFCLSFLINNKNQENFTICNYTLLKNEGLFNTIQSFQAVDFNLTYFKTNDFDILSYNDTLISFNLILVFILNPPFIIEKSDFLAMELFFLTFPNNTVQITLTNALISSPIESPLTITLLNNTKNDNISAILSTDKCFFEILFDFVGNFFISYTYEHYHRCENLNEKPIFFQPFLISVCKREYKGEDDPKILPIFRNIANFTTLMIYRKSSASNNSYPIRMLTNYIADESYRKKFLIFEGIRPTGKKVNKLVVSDPFNFLIVHELYENITFYPKKRGMKVTEIEKNYIGTLKTNNNFDSSEIMLVFPTPKLRNLNKIIISVIYGLLTGVGFLMLLRFLFFAIRKKEERKNMKDKKYLDLSKSKNSSGSMIYDSNILTGSIQHRLSVKRLTEKGRKRNKSTKKLKPKEKV